ncbi:MAG: NAD-dependent deacylase [Zoogloeaceae bacterium]|jgi:NAD-dependent deacetylase|nr:NAD-dependent deacylase [Zoogloeaceae bacterium]
MNTLILTGAGISAESGIPTFRDVAGLWESHDLRQIASPETFARDPALVHRFYNQRRRQLVSGEVRPNAAHFALGELQRHFPEQITLVTQNVDNLHERGGAKRVLHMHGELLKVRCVACQTRRQWLGDLSTEDACPICGCRLRPDIVWFGELPFCLEAIEAALSVAELFVSIGTSGLAYPAAGFVDRARQRGIYTLEINLRPTTHHQGFTEGRYGLASVEVPRWVEERLHAVEA